MSDSQPPAQQWNSVVEQWNEQFLDALEQNVEAQAQFVESWSGSVDDVTEGEELSEGVQGYARAYETWMSASQRMVEQLTETLEGEDLDVEAFRDIWLDTANEAFKEVMSTTAFAQATGETVGDVFELQQQADEASQETLRTLGFATEDDVVEVGDRLVELERRQHAVETKLDRILEHLDE
ncbi:poly(R)-hydroxyalkanoic acid synthase subunit PhaE [Natronorubrum daqingense]|uniref:Poly(3-hydroxyalkanoate) polymerase subunit PhaE n=1 Tax=Natronorubrum daqingense TaxID=588898 RepID=A0A1N7BR98_9EURY|nr:poly(R)-hydroxyalkanoic acid synthase subunit PhaE [Natronorubrum daqingense]APX96564.1 poly(R)-hydroxyalkanoic acid synthase subunit [Natronorubrum daqingense]SIR53796.1 Poly(R)-hydroxyalkanoic acid synthase subunit (PHA_synth_III_E) [Natronorubrum daqingense]